jgi:hypothetical protein
VVAGAQQAGDIAVAKTPPMDATTVTEHTYPNSGFLPLRRVERRTESGGRKVIIETVEAPGVEGKWQPLEEVVSEPTQRDVFRFDLDRRRRLAETTQSEESQSNASTRNAQRTWVADLDGRLTLSSAYREETRVVAPGIRQTEATVSIQSAEPSLRDVERSVSTEQQVSPAIVRRDNTHLVRDLNGRWVPTETRSGETRGIGSAERIEEETIQRPNLTGALVLHDKIVTRTWESNGETQVVIETYSQDAEGFVRSENRLALRERVRRSTTVTADGGRSTVEEIEARNPIAPNDPIRVVQRTVETVRSVGVGRRVIERQIFERDQNGRMFLVANDTEETTGK